MLGLKLESKIQAKGNARTETKSSNHDPEFLLTTEGIIDSRFVT